MFSIVKSLSFIRIVCLILELYRGHPCCSRLRIYSVFFNGCLDLKTRCGERYDTRTKNIFVMNKDLLYEKGNKIVIRSS